MTQEQFLNFTRHFRRPYASILCSTALAGGTAYGVQTGNFIPEGLAWALVAVIVADGTHRAIEKIRGRANANTENP